MQWAAEAKPCCTEDRRTPRSSYRLLDRLDPVKRKARCNVAFCRRYEQSLANWEPANPGRFAFFVRKDIAAELRDERPTTVG